MSGELEQDYLRSGFNRRLGFGERPALLIIDFVNAYLTPGEPLYAGVEDTLAAAVRLLGAAREAAIPIFFTKVVYEDGQDSGPFFRKVGALQHFVGETYAGEIADDLAPAPGEVVLRKQFASAFFATDLTARLEELGVDSVIISGLSTSGCVRASAIDAVQAGLIPLVVREAVGDRAPGPHEASLFDLDAKYADVLGLDDLVAHLRERPRDG